VPNEIYDQNDRGYPMDDPAEIEGLFRREEPLEGLEFVKKKRDPCDHKQEERADQEIMLDPFSEIHPQEDFVVGYKGRAIHVFPS
jgi:hypothetical protein